MITNLFILLFIRKERVYWVTYMIRVFFLNLCICQACLACVSAAQPHKPIIIVVVAWVNHLVVIPRWSNGGTTVIVTQCYCPAVVIVSQTVIHSLRSVIYCTAYMGLIPTVVTQWSWQLSYSWCHQSNCHKFFKICHLLCSLWGWNTFHSHGGHTVIVTQRCCHTIVVISQTVINSLRFVIYCAAYMGLTDFLVSLFLPQMLPLSSVSCTAKHRLWMVVQVIF